MGTDAVRLFVASAGNHVMKDIAEVFARGFEAQRLAADVAVDEIPLATPPRGLLQIVVAPHEFFPLFAEPATSPGVAADIGRGVHLLNVEQPGSLWFETAWRYAEGARGVLDISRVGAAELSRRGLAAIHAPLGHAACPGEAAPLDAPREVDVVFLGSHSWRREQFFSRHADFFAAHRCRLLFARLERPRLASTPGFLTGDALRALLRSARVLVNLHAGETGYFEWHRALLAVAQGCVVVSEVGDVAPLRPGEDLVTEEIDRLPEECRRLLRDEDARRRMATRAYHRMTHELDAAAICGRVLDRLAALTTPPNGGGRPAARPAAVSPTPAAAVAGGEGRSPEAGLAARLDALSATVARIDEEMRALAADTGADAAVQALHVRRQLARAREADGLLVAVESKNVAAERTGAPPGVSVVVTLYNYAAHIEECLRSAFSADAAGIAGGVEVVVVDDGSTDGSAAAVERLMAEGPTPVRLFRKTLNTGLADARNLGVRAARAPYVFVLDADNWIYPRCLTTLHDAIRRGGHAAVFAIIRKFDEDGGPAGLASCYPWDVRELLARPYIDAMALFDRRVLLDLDGYSTELLWMGWEDYDLWLKLAQSGRSCALVPEILSAYRVHPASMITDTRRRADLLVRHFRRKFTALVARYPELPTLFGLPR